MEIIREGPSAFRPSILDGKNYSYWKPRMIFFIKTLDGKAWRALVAGYDPLMIIVNGVSIPKPEVDWTDVEEQASVGNARALNAIFNGVDLNVFKLINYCSTAKEAWKTLEVAYEGTSKVKISRLQLKTSKFEALRMTEDESVSDYNKIVLEIANESLLLVTAIEEAHDITTLKLDELFGSLLTFEMTTANRESKKGKGIAFKSTHVNEEADCDTEANMDECRECGGVGHYQAECLTFLRKQKKNFRVTLSDKEFVDSRDDDGNINAFTIRITNKNTDDDSECSIESKNDELSIEKLETLWKEDCEARAIQKERIQDLLEENERLMSNLDSILKAGHNGSHRYGLGFVASASSSKATSEIKFVPASMRVEYDTIHTKTGIRTPVKSLGRTCYYCGRKGHIRSICYKLKRDQLRQQKHWNRSRAQPRMVLRIKSAERCKVAFTSVQTADDVWYFDSGCSRHMNGNRSYFTNLNDCVIRHVTFGDGAKGKIIAKGNIDKDDLSRLNDVRYVDGLKANLINISQLCDQGYKVSFDDIGCVVLNKENQICMSGKRQADNCYHWNSNMSDTCQLIRSDQTWLWHRKLGHVSMRGLEKVIKNKAVVGIPNLDVNGNFFCEDCQIGKQTRSTHKSLKECYTNRVLELLHMDLMGPMQTKSLGGKTDTVEICKNLCLKLQREEVKKITRIRSDHGKEFDNEGFNSFCLLEGTHHEFSAPITPQQNGVVERKNKTLQEMARVMIHAKNLPLCFFAEAVNTACHIHNRVTIRTGTTITLYEHWKERKLNVKYFHVFGSTCYILADREYHKKWDARSEQGIFLRYSQISRAYRVYNNRSDSVMETINEFINDLDSAIKLMNDEEDETPNMSEVRTTSTVEESKADNSSDGPGKSLKKSSEEIINKKLELIPSAHVEKNHPARSIIGDPSAGMQTRRKDKIDYLKMVANLCYISTIEPSTVDSALKNEYWLNAMQEELLQFKRNNV
ncbi:gag-pol polyprotein [Cucumis melo var. makuwa]|uniref:Gag-pol polyprotein n=1 Tax=Cucumis melo var. makuwa TaxID=1194695 RepID=A0A5A7TNK7_CUCMM|nr:gag-pol polyprotein [Cucumis melo var. makuwa]